MASPVTPQPSSSDGGHDDSEISAPGNPPENIPMENLDLVRLNTNPESPRAFDPNRESSQAAEVDASARDTSAPGDSKAADAATVKRPSSLRASVAGLAIDRGPQGSQDSLAIERMAQDTTFSFVEGEEPIQPPKEDTSPRGKLPEEHVDLGGHLRQLDADRRYMDRNIGALQRTFGKSSMTYTSRTLNQEWATSIEKLVKLREHNQETADEIRKSIGRTAWSKEDRYLSPEARGQMGALGLMTGANLAKEVVWYVPAALKKFWEQYLAGYGGALTVEYTLQTEAAKLWKAAGGDPIAFTAGSQVNDMGIAPGVLKLNDIVRHKGQDSTGLLPFMAFMGTSAISAGWVPERVKKFFGFKPEEFVVSAGGNVEAPRGVRASKQADDLKFLNGILLASMGYEEMHQRIVAADADLATHYRQHPEKRSKSAPSKTIYPPEKVSKSKKEQASDNNKVFEALQEIGAKKEEDGAYKIIVKDNEDNKIYLGDSEISLQNEYVEAARRLPIDICAAPDTTDLKDYLKATEDMLHEINGGSAREYSVAGGSLGFAVTAGVMSAVLGKKHRAYQSAGFLLGSVSLQGLAQLANFIHIPGEEILPDRLASVLKIAGPLAGEYALLQLGTKSAEESPPGAYPGLIVNRYGQEALRNCAGAIIGWGLAGDQLGYHNLAGCLMAAGTAAVSYGVEYKKDRDSHKLLGMPLLAASHKASDQSISMMDEDTANSNRTEIEQAPSGEQSKRDLESNAARRPLLRGQRRAPRTITLSPPASAPTEAPVITVEVVSNSGSETPNIDAVYELISGGKGSPRNSSANSLEAQAEPTSLKPLQPLQPSKLSTLRRLALAALTASSPQNYGQSRSGFQIRGGQYPSLSR